MKKFLLALATATVLLSCKKEKSAPAEVILPPSVVSLSRSFLYPVDNSMANVTYAGNSITGKASIAEDKSLVIDIETPFPSGNDNVSFVIPQAKIKAGYAGDYISQPNSADAAILYQYRLTATSSNKLLPGAAVGTLKIATYNADLKTLTGQFSFVINAQSDPVSSAVNNFKQTTITVIGNFENLAIK
jgi:hypothetical protein